MSYYYSGYDQGQQHQQGYGVNQQAQARSSRGFPYAGRANNPQWNGYNYNQQVPQQQYNGYGNYHQPAAQNNNYYAPPASSHQNYNAAPSANYNYNYNNNNSYHQNQPSNPTYNQGYQHNNHGYQAPNAYHQPPPQNQFSLSGMYGGQPQPPAASQYQQTPSTVHGAIENADIFQTSSKKNRYKANDYNSSFDVSKFQLAPGTAGLPALAFIPPTSGSDAPQNPFAAPSAAAPPRPRSNSSTLSPPSPQSSPVASPAAQMPAMYVPSTPSTPSVPASNTSLKVEQPVQPRRPSNPPMYTPSAPAANPSPSSSPSENVEETPVLQRFLTTRKVVPVEERRKAYDVEKQEVVKQRGQIQRIATKKILQVAKQDRDAELKSLFERYDSDRSKTLSVTELASALLTWGIELPSEAIEAIANSFSKVKGAKKPTVTFDEFKQLADFFLDLRKKFDQSDLDKSETMSKAELFKLLAEFGLTLSQSTLDDLASEFNRDTSKEISYNEAITLLIYLRDIQTHFETKAQGGFIVAAGDLQSLLRLLNINVTVDEANIFLRNQITQTVAVKSFSHFVNLLVRVKKELPEIREQARKAAEAKHEEERKLFQTQRTKTISKKPSSIFRTVTKRPDAFTTVVPVKPQAKDLSELQKIIEECKRTGKKFEDASFAPSASILYPKEPKLAAKVAGWKRPNEINPKFQLFVDGIDEGDVVQGGLGDCWFLSALSTLGQVGNNDIENLFVAKYPEFGVYQVRFYKNGEWRVVTIDDRIPVTSSGRPAFASCRDPDEFWVPLVEKAYAKIHGSYEAIESGLISDALVDLTGDASESIFDVADRDIESHDKFWDMILANVQEGFLMGCSRAEPAMKAEEETPLGILVNHAYGVLTAEEVDGVRLLRVRNPWGNHEWKGRWSDGAREWTPALQRHFDYEFADDGTFFMCFEDFCRQFNRMYVLRTPGANWSRYEFKGDWTVDNAGGCINHASFPKNPQWQLKVSAPTTLFVSLKQNDRRMMAGEKKTAPYEPIGLVVLRKDKSDNYRTEAADGEHTLSVSNYSSGHSIEVDVPAGDIVLVPNTFKPGVLMPYYITVYADVKLAAAPLNLTQSPPSASIKGEWKGITAGGCPNHSTWRNNPQYLLTVTKAMSVDLVLLQSASNLSGKLAHIGLYVWQTDSVGHRKLDSAQPFFQTQLIDAGQDIEIVGGNVAFPAGKFVVMPCTYEPKVETIFELKAVSTEVSLTPAVEWSAVSQNGEWKAGLAGGCTNHKTWQQNPKFSFKLSEKTSFTIVVELVGDGQKPGLGFYVFKPDLKGAGEIKSRFLRGSSNSQEGVLEKGDYVLLTCTFDPNFFGKFKVSVYSDRPVALSPM